MLQVLGSGATVQRNQITPMKRSILCHYDHQEREGLSYSQPGDLLASSLHSLLTQVAINFTSSSSRQLRGTPVMRAGVRSAIFRNASLWTIFI
ncbi:hypothetical protein E2C01_048132 [Portunus trituberculatus]|uniref:Uncharacterized protein n=1 Tax=Portunus trituberculatus TaxID=210409 RepID=A0A5B7GAC4_PORTR|nr:hypothetical protein [Portunus trituberculatus]